MKFQVLTFRFNHIIVSVNVVVVELMYERCVHSEWVLVPGLDVVTDVESLLPNKGKYS